MVEFEGVVWVVVFNNSTSAYINGNCKRYERRRETVYCVAHTHPLLHGFGQLFVQEQATNAQPTARSPSWFESVCFGAPWQEYGQ